METVVSRVISEQDLMFNPRYPEAYFRVGEAVLRAVKTGLELAGVEPQRVLDLPCGHGQGLRWFATAFDDIVACDLDPHAVDFCAQEFGVTPLYSHPEPEQIPLDGTFDLITCGSLFTHLDAPMWPRFLRVFREHLSPEGMLAFSTGGRSWLADIRARLTRDLGSEQTADELLSSYEQTGFGYADYPSSPGYGLARAKPAWVMPLLADFRVIHMSEGGWDAWQDAWCVTS